MWKEAPRSVAVFSLGSAGDINGLDDIKKVQDYLIKLDRNLKYMFANLDPEDNYSDQARLIYVADQERQASIEVSLEQISLNYVSKNGVVSAINLSDENIQISAEKIRLEGVVTVNGNFKVGLDGSIEANNGFFKGDISASTITGSTIEGSHIYASYYGSRTANDFFIIAEDDVTVVGTPGFEFKNRKMTSNWIGSVENPALGTDQAGINGNSGAAGFSEIYLLTGRYAGRALSDVLYDIEQSGGGDDGGDDGGGGYNNNDDMPGEGTVGGG